MSSTKTKSQRLAKLFSQRKDVDIENADIHEDGTIANEDDDIELPEQEYISEKAKKAPEKRLLLRAGIPEDEKYKGKTITRSELYGDDDDDEDTNELADLFEHDEGDLEEVREEMKRFQEMMETQEDSEDSDDDEGEQDLQNHISELELENKKILRGMQKDLEKEILKARSVFNQKILYDSLLKLRILMQKPLTTMNRLPQFDTFDTFKEIEPRIDEEFSEVSKLLFSTVEDLLELQKELLKNNPKVKPNVKKEYEEDENDDKIDALWNRINYQYNNYSNYKSQSLEEWNRRTKLGSVAGRELKSINTSLKNQMDNIMRDADKWIRRTRIKRFPQKILGKRKRDDAETTNDDHTQDEEIDEEIFDDRDFYQSLLRDLIQDVGISNIGKEGQSIKQAISKNKKKKKHMHFKSKGRTLRYVVQPLMVGYMSAKPTEIPESADTLFKSLFGGIPEKFKNKLHKPKIEEEKEETKEEGDQKSTNKETNEDEEKLPKKEEPMDEDMESDDEDNIDYEGDDMDLSKFMSKK